MLVDLTTSAYRGKTVQIEVRRANGDVATRQLATSEMGGVDEERIFDQLGLKPWHWEPPATVGALRAGDPAELAGRSRATASSRWATPKSTASPP